MRSTGLVLAAGGAGWDADRPRGLLDAMVGRTGRADADDAAHRHPGVRRSLKKPEDIIPTIVGFLDNGGHRVHYARRPFGSEPDFGATSVSSDFAELLDWAEPPS